MFDDTEKTPGNLYTVKEVEKSKELATVENGLAIYQERANALQVADQPGYDNAADFCKDIKTANKKIEERRKFFATPYAEAKKAIDAMFKDKITALTQIEKTVKSKMLAWHEAQTLAADQERKRIEAENAQKLADAKDGEMPPVLTPTTINVNQTSKTENATSTVRKIKKWRVVDEKLIPREFLCIDEKKVNAVVQADLDIPGIERYYENSLAIK